MFDPSASTSARASSASGFGWRGGHGVDHHHREPGWPAERFTPYRVELDDGGQVWAAVDDDVRIRELI